MNSCDSDDVSIEGIVDDESVGVGMVLVHTFNVAGYFDGYTYRIATPEGRASLDRAAALARTQDQTEF